LPDELDQLSGLAHPWTWLGVAALALAVAALVIWSFAGTIPRTVNGTGVLAERGGVDAVDSTVSGQVTKLLEGQDAYVQAGQTIAVVGSGAMQTSVRAPFSGQLIDVAIIPGQVVQFGDPLFTIQRASASGQHIWLYLFVPTADGADLAPGMAVNVSVATAPSAKYGVLRGKIATVSEAPLSTASVSALVANPDLAQVLTKDGPPILAQVHLTADPSTRSRYSWSTPKGPPFVLEPGTPATAQVVEQEQRPIDVIFGT
jgi:multidrug resistance efflux pump